MIQDTQYFQFSLPECVQADLHLLRGCTQPNLPITSQLIQTVEVRTSFTQYAVPRLGSWVCVFEYHFSFWHIVYFFSLKNVHWYLKMLLVQMKWNDLCIGFVCYLLFVSLSTLHIHKALLSTFTFVETEPKIKLLPQKAEEILNCCFIA